MPQRRPTALSTGLVRLGPHATWSRLIPSCSHVNKSPCSDPADVTGEGTGGQSAGTAGGSDAGGLRPQAWSEPGDADTPGERSAEHDHQDAGADRQGPALRDRPVVRAAIDARAILRFKPRGWSKLVAGSAR